MKRPFHTLFLSLLATLLLAGCGAKPLMRMRLRGTEGLRIEQFGAGFVEGTMRFEVENRHATRVVFDDGRLDLKWGDRTVGTVKLRESFAVEPGVSRVEAPVRIRFGSGVADLVREAIRTVGGAKQGGRKNLDFRVTGNFRIVAGRPLRERTVRFDRRVERRQVEAALGALSAGLVR